jgi:hypothetical protein
MTHFLGAKRETILRFRSLHVKRDSPTDYCMKLSDPLCTTQLRSKENVYCAELLSQLNVILNM